MVPDVQKEINRIRNQREATATEAPDMPRGLRTPEQEQELDAKRWRSLHPTQMITEAERLATHAAKTLPEDPLSNLNSRSVDVAIQLGQLWALIAIAKKLDLEDISVLM